ncbi:MAG TPA: hypothetical protein VNQ73_19235 [Ilumatobacter sp.]|nr:hypothetical protein [Ilumatobacter sp.]
MRQIFSIRFFAAVAAVAGLFLLLALTLGDDDPVVPDLAPVTTPMPRRVDFVDWIYESTTPEFGVTDGRADADTQFVIDGSRRLDVKRGTLGEQHCPEFGQIVRCAFLVDLLGEGVVWFAIVPMNANRTVDLPAIDTLDQGIATLVNGWQMPYAPILDRICADFDFVSYRELRNTLGDDFTAVYSIDEQRLVAVECGRRVAYAPSVPVPSTTVPSTSVPSSTAG